MRAWIRRSLAPLHKLTSKIRSAGWLGKRASSPDNDKLSIAEPAEEAISVPSSNNHHPQPSNEPLPIPVQQPLGWMSRIRQYKTTIAKGVGAFGLVAAITVGGNYYVESNTLDLYDVYVLDKWIGTVNDPQIVEDFKIAKYKELEAKWQNVNMILNTDEVVLKQERAFKKPFDNEAALAELDRYLVPEAMGVQLKVNGEEVAIVKDRETAESILDDIMSQYTGESAAKASNQVSILSAEAQTEQEEAVLGVSKIREAEFMQEIDFVSLTVDPEEVAEPEEVKELLETGAVTPVTHTVVQGDCVGCIAHQYKIPVDVIYENNPWIVDDRIKEGDELNLTVLEPKLSVKTVEELVEQQEIHFETETITDDEMKVGETEVIQAGQNGQKLITFRLTKINGQLREEEIISEEITVEPVKAIIKKGTKVVGEGTGNFAWPVESANISSGYGMRWGRLHKGIDITSSKRDILAADHGKVKEAGYRYDYGNYVIIDHQNGYETLYGHLSQLDTEAGAIVEQGDKIGVMGSTGDSTGVHLHFEIINSGKVENPMKYLNR
ncbi:M23 family metallopeptidase [Paenibacillus senegalensis]|uniref:M23 family metallopeptidase n=1 Tax=Paenibacillus senegalensis TaxID=1465766 RepID=UPI001651DE6C|nr:M23 family metallopeptidase [Paenibacillus senegalensis]